ncbi:hypothetical protein CLONEX_02672 [[Clostridium] nexile DSM 1787]|nr:hypothetical protein CLONEX_02672 [[Clostridium] nexile DSM 1787]
MHKSEKNARKKERNLFFNANNFENGVRIIRKNEKNVDKNGEL